jgi:hypothetical protein
VSFGLLYNQSPPGVRFLNKIISKDGVVGSMPNPILDDQSVWTLPFDLTGTGYNRRSGSKSFLMRHAEFGI